MNRRKVVKKEAIRIDFSDIAKSIGRRNINDFEGN